MPSPNVPSRAADEGVATQLGISLGRHEWPFGAGRRCQSSGEGAPPAAAKETAHLAPLLQPLARGRGQGETAAGRGPPPSKTRAENPGLPAPPGARGPWRPR